MQKLRQGEERTEREQEKKKYKGEKLDESPGLVL
jgi:hypothetical protein